MNPILGLFIASVLGVSYQFLQTRILGVVYWQHLAYAVVGLAMTGFAISGVAIRKNETLRKLLRWNFWATGFLGFGMSATLSLLAITLVPAEGFFLDKSFFRVSNLALFLFNVVVSVLPYFFWGVMAIGVFHERLTSSAKACFSNLIGTAVGGLVFVFCFSPLGAELYFAALIYIPAITAAWYSARRLEVRKWLLVASTCFATLLIAIHPVPEAHKLFWTRFRGDGVMSTRWNPISRVDVMRDEFTGVKSILLDGDAQADVLPNRGRIIQTADYYRAEGAKAKFVALGETGSVLINKILPDSKAFSMALTLESHQRVGLAVEILGVEGAQLFPIFTNEKSVREVYVTLDSRRGRVIFWNEGEFSAAPITRSEKRLPFRIRLVPLDRKEKLASVKTLLWGQWNRGLDLNEALTFFNRLIDPDRHLVHRLLGAENAIPNAKVLVIGNGGGADVMTALRYQPSEITSVEVNPDSVRALKEHFSEYTGGAFQSNKVHLVQAEGREFLSKRPDRFDVIQMVGVDSFAASLTGAYVLSESYLYTLEAFSECWDHLSEHGKIQVSRWSHPDTSRETLRAFATAWEMLRRKGVAHPERHLMQVKFATSNSEVEAMGTLLISKNPLSPQTVSDFQSDIAAVGMALEFSPEKADGAFAQFSKSAVAGKTETFYAGFPFRVAPVSDDSPFFFHYQKWGQVFGGSSSPKLGFDAINGKWPYVTWGLIFSFTMILGVFLAWLSREPQSLERPLSMGGRAHFSLLGFGFFLVEIALIQRWVLVFGQPIFAMAVVPPIILVAAGLGALVSERLSSRFSWGCYLLLLSAIVTHFFFGAEMVGALRGKSMLVRLFGTAVFLGPLGFFMGIPFASSLKRLVSPLSVSQAWTVNSIACVIGVFAAPCFALFYGFTWTLLVAFASYGVAGILIPKNLHTPETECSLIGGSFRPSHS